MSCSGVWAGSVVRDSVVLPITEEDFRQSIREGTTRELYGAYLRDPAHSELIMAPSGWTEKESMELVDLFRAGCPPQECDAPDQLPSPVRQMLTTFDEKEDWEYFIEESRQDMQRLEELEARFNGPRGGARGIIGPEIRVNQTAKQRKEQEKRLKPQPGPQPRPVWDSHGRHFPGKDEWKWWEHCLFALMHPRQYLMMHDIEKALQEIREERALLIRESIRIVPVPCWRLAADWSYFDGTLSCPDQVLVVELDEVNARVYRLYHPTGDLLDSRLLAGYGYSTAEFVPAQWRDYCLENIQYVLQGVRGEIEIVVVGSLDPLRGEIEQMLCEGLHSAGFMAYRVDLSDIELMERDRRFLSHSMVLRDEGTMLDTLPVREIWPYVVGAMGIMFIICMLFALVPTFLPGYERPPSKNSRLSSHSSLMLHSPSRYSGAQDESQDRRAPLTIEGKKMVFPGGTFQLPEGWHVEFATPLGTKTGEWRRKILFDKDPNVRVLLSSQSDPLRQLGPQLAERVRLSAQGESAAGPVGQGEPLYEIWEEPYAAYPELQSRHFVLAYKELTDRESRVLWIVLYSGDTAVSVGCQFRYRGGMSEERALDLCAPLVASVRMDSAQ